MTESVHIISDGKPIATEADYQRFEQDYEQQEQLRQALQKVLGDVYRSCGGRESDVQVRLQRITQNTSYGWPYGMVVVIDGKRVAEQGSVPKPIAELYRALKRGFMTTHGIASGISHEGVIYEIYTCHQSVGKLAKAIDRTIHGINIVVPHWSHAPKKAVCLPSLAATLGAPTMPFTEGYRPQQGVSEF